MPDPVKQGPGRPFTRQSKGDRALTAKKLDLLRSLADLDAELAQERVGTARFGSPVPIRSRLAPSDDVAGERVLANLDATFDLAFSRAVSNAMADFDAGRLDKAGLNRAIDAIETTFDRPSSRRSQPPAGGTVAEWLRKPKPGGPAGGTMELLREPEFGGAGGNPRLLFGGMGLSRVPPYIPPDEVTTPAEAAEKQARLRARARLRALGQLGTAPESGTSTRSTLQAP